MGGLTEEDLERLRAVIREEVRAAAENARTPRARKQRTRRVASAEMHAKIARKLRR
jgi:hypothetical protein